jgi:uncharacterized protein
MKYSQFNSVIPYNEKYALFNSFNKKFLFLAPELKDLLQAAKNEGIDNLSAVHPTFYKYLADHQFLVDTSTDEVAKVKAISKKVDENTDSFMLTINPTMNCNFKCWYCYETHVKDSKLSIDTIERIKRFIAHTTSNADLKAFSLSFFGGEPLLYFKKVVVPVVDYFEEKVIEKNLSSHVSFTTNGYLINQEFVDYFLSKKLICSVQITLDGYKEEHDKVRYVNSTKGSYEEIIRNIRLMIQNKFFVRLRINYTNKNIGNGQKIADEFADLPKEIRENYLLFDYHRVWQDHKLDNTSELLDENLNAVRERGLSASGGYAPNNVLDSCYADKRNSAVINYNGDIFKCTARDFLSANRAGYLNESGELIWENNYLDRRMEAKFNNRPCQTCRIMPLCNGGCSQHAMEKLGEDYCVYLGDEEEKSKVVRSTIQSILDGVPA